MERLTDKMLTEACEIAISALTPLTQEQMKELYPGCDFCKKELNDYLFITARAENAQLRAELEQVKAEKDAAVESIPHECKTCVYHTVFFNGCTLDHDCTNPDGGCSNNYDRWIWRGPHKED